MRGQVQHRPTRGKMERQTRSRNDEHICRPRDGDVSFPKSSEQQTEAKISTLVQCKNGRRGLRRQTTGTVQDDPEVVEMVQKTGHLFNRADSAQCVHDLQTSWQEFNLQAVSTGLGGRNIEEKSITTKATAKIVGFG